MAAARRMPSQQDGPAAHLRLPEDKRNHLQKLEPGGWENGDERLSYGAQACRRAPRVKTWRTEGKENREDLSLLVARKCDEGLFLALEEEQKRGVRALE